MRRQIRVAIATALFAIGGQQVPSHSIPSSPVDHFAIQAAGTLVVSEPLPVHCYDPDPPCGIEVDVNYSMGGSSVAYQGTYAGAAYDGVTSFTGDGYGEEETRSSGEGSTKWWIELEGGPDIAYLICSNYFERDTGIMHFDHVCWVASSADDWIEDFNLLDLIGSCEWGWTYRDGTPYSFIDYSGECEFTGTTPALVGVDAAVAGVHLRWEWILARDPGQASEGGELDFVGYEVCRGDDLNADDVCTIVEASIEGCPVKKDFVKDVAELLRTPFPFPVRCPDGGGYVDTNVPAGLHFYTVSIATASSLRGRPSPPFPVVVPAA